jgi:hypothetical protein
LLAAYLIWAATRARSIESEGSGIGPLAEMAAAAAAFSAGWFVTPVEPLVGPVAAQAAGVALVAVAIVPLTGRDVMRVGAGAAVLVIGGSLLLEAWVGAASSLGQIVVTALLVGIAGATGTLMSPMDIPAARRVSAAPPSEEPVAPAVPIVASGGGQLVEAGPHVLDAEIAAAAYHSASEERTAPVRTRPSRGEVAGPMAVRKAPRKAAARPVAEEPDSSPAPETPAKSQVRTASVRASRTRSLRTADQVDVRTTLEETEPAGESTLESDAVPEALPRSGWIASRVRRLRPREPRR